MNQPGKEKAPEGAQVEQNPDTAMPDSQGFLEAKEWLGKRTCELRHAGISASWDSDKPWCQFWIEDSFAVLVAMLGEESARMFLMSKYDTVKGGQKFNQPQTPNPTISLGRWPGAFIQIGQTYYVRMCCGCIAGNWFSRQQTSREIADMRASAARRKCDKCKGGRNG